MPDAPRIPEDVQAADWVARNRAYKRNARRWADSGPGPRLCVLKTAMLVMAALMHRALQVAGVEWQRQQEKKASQGQDRSYRMLEAAFSQDLRDYFVGMIRILLRLPQGLSLSKMTLPLKLLMLRVVARSMCSLHVLLRVAREMHPYLLFRSLLTHEYDKTPPCMWDSLRTFFHESFPDFSEDARASLEALAETMDRCISTIEARHALTRRLTVARGVQTWIPKLASTSAEFCLRQVLLQQGPEAFASQASDEPAGKTKPEKKRRGGGGACRAFLHEHSAGRRFTKSSLKELLQEFHSLDPTALAYYEDLGKRAAFAHRNGYHSFGERKPRVPRTAQQALADNAPMVSGQHLTSRICVLGGRR